MDRTLGPLLETIQHESGENRFAKHQEGPKEQANQRVYHSNPRPNYEPRCLRIDFDQDKGPRIVNDRLWTITPCEFRNDDSVITI